MNKLRLFQTVQFFSGPAYGRLSYNFFFLQLQDVSYFSYTLNISLVVKKLRTPSKIPRNVFDFNQSTNDRLQLRSY